MLNKFIQNQIIVKKSSTATITMPPSLNTMYVNVPGKGRVKNGKYDLWGNSVIPYLALALYRVEGEVHIHYQFHLGSAFRGDISNRIKPVEDALVKAGIITDDNHKVVKAFSVGLDYEKDQGSSVTVTVTSLKKNSAIAIYEIIERFKSALSNLHKD
jgi:Holliday junction resolvase RusA-like endonuclease